jgi:acyl-CoA synthetase (AMP-forming)/AMP-acid ligase II
MEPKQAESFQKIWTEIVARHGDLAAIEINGTTLNYRDLDSSAQGVARSLCSLASWRAGARMGLEVSRPGFFSELLGVWLAGGVPVPLRKATLNKEPALRRLVESVVEGWMGSDELSCGNNVPGEDAWHAIYFTSGSTGDPKAVVRGWRQALHEGRCYADTLGLSAGMKCSMLVDPMFGASTKHFLGCLLAGCIQSFGESASREGHVLYGTPGQISAFAEEFGGCFQWISMTGEACSPRAWKAAMKLTGIEGRILNALGGSEFGVAANQIHDARSGVPASFCGIPLQGKRLEVTDEAGTALPPGETGLLRVISENLAEGYLVRNADGFRLETFPIGAGSRFFVTGDVGWIDSGGSFNHVGRSGKMYKRGARWVDTGPLCRALESCAGVREFVVDWPAGSLHPLVWCGLEDVSAHALEEISSRILAEGLDGQIVPTELRGVEQLPRNRHGKIDLAALASPTNTLEGRFASFKISNRIPEMAEALLRGDAKDAIFHGADSLLALDLDSLSLHELAAKLSEKMQRRIPLATLLADLPLTSLIENLRNPTSHALTLLGNDRRNPILLWFGGGLASLAKPPLKSFSLLGLDYEKSMKNPVGKNSNGIHELIRILIDCHSEEIANRTVFTGGFSFGALLAHEAGLELQRRKAAVGGVFLVDPPNLEARAIRTVWRWSRWRPWIWILVLAPLQGVGLPLVQRRLVKENFLRNREWRRTWMRFYRPTPTNIETTLFSSKENSDGSLGLFRPACPRLSIQQLPAQKHLDVVRDSQSISQWTAFVRDQISRGIKEQEPWQG